MSTEAIRLIRDREKVCGGGGEGGMEVGGGGRGRLYTDHDNVTTRMTSALRWAAMRAILMFHNCEGHSHKTMSTDHNLWRERRAEADSNRSPSAYQPNALLLGQTGSQTPKSNKLLFQLQGWLCKLRWYLQVQYLNTRQHGHHRLCFCMNLFNMNKTHSNWQF